MPKTHEFPNGSRIQVQDSCSLGDRLEVGPDVVIECSSLQVGRNVKIGVPGTDAFRLPGGVRIQAEKLVLGDGVTIGRHTWIRGGTIEFRRQVAVHNDVTMHVLDRLVIDVGGGVNDYCEISGRNIHFGRRLWMLPGAKIGGGSGFEVHSRLDCGHWCHIGSRSFLNTARPITIGDEVALGTGTGLYTHGAYPSALEGKPAAFGPISIGDRTWIPGAIINPSVSIGKDCVIGVGSVVAQSVPDGALAVGIPAKVLRNVYPRPLTGQARITFMQDFLKTFAEVCADKYETRFEANGEIAKALVGSSEMYYAPRAADLTLENATIVMTDEDGGAALPSSSTLVDFATKRIRGAANPLTERLLNQLRRYGIRFNYEATNGTYQPWQD